MAATILAAARIEAGKLREHTQNITAWQDNKLSFEIENKYKDHFVPIVSHCHNVSYVTSSYWIKEIGPEYITVIRCSRHKRQNVGCDRFYRCYRKYHLSYCAAK